MEDEKVNLFVVGAMKAGTTSFVDLLSHHPRLYVSPVKEPHFFVDTLPKELYEPSRFFHLDRYLNESFPEPLHITKIENEAQYKKIYSRADNCEYKIDASTAYLHAEESTALIHRYQPEAKIIIILRDPLKRAYSHYKMNLGKGRIKHSFEKIILKDIERYHQGTLAWYSYLGMSLYQKAIERYKKMFNHVLVIRFEDLISNQAKVLADVALFLNIEAFYEEELSAKNTAKELRFQKLFYILKKLGLNDYFSKYVNRNFRQRLFRWVSKDPSKKIPLSHKTSQELEAIFTKENMQ